MPPSLRIRRLERGDVRSGFTSGEPLLDDFLHRFAGQNQFRRHIAVTYVAVEESTREVLGYVTVAAGTMTADESSEAGLGTPAYGQLPVLRLARLAVDRRLHGSGLGTELLRYALALAVLQSRSVGCAGVVVDAKPDSVSYYERFGFRRCEVARGGTSVRPRQVVMFLSLGTIVAALAEVDE